VEFDVSGVLLDLYRSAEILSDEQAFELVSGARPGLPKILGEEPDLVVSANVCSQLMLLPASWMVKKRARYDDFARLLQIAGTRRHVEWLRERAGAQVFITDVLRHQIDRSGVELERKEIVGLAGLRDADRSWRWRIAPIPERDRNFHIEYTVAAWVGRL
jgi:hypothetical protein